MSSLAHDFPIEQARVREVLAVYRSLGVPGFFGATLIEDTLRRADEAAVSGDVIAMLRVYEEMRGIE